MQSPPGGGLLPRRLPPPSLDEGPHLNYAIQWFAFATIALVGAGAYLISKHR
jgi:surfeit locus 1 family protein